MSSSPQNTSKKWRRCDWTESLIPLLSCKCNLSTSVAVANGNVGWKEGGLHASWDLGVVRVVFCCRDEGGTAAMSEKTTGGNLLRLAKPLDLAHRNNATSPGGCLRSTLSRPDILTRIAQSIKWVRIAQSIKWLRYGEHVRTWADDPRHQTGPGDLQSLQWITGSFLGYKECTELYLQSALIL